MILINLPKLEKDFFMWNANDFRIIINKITSKNEIINAETKSRPTGWPLQTITITISDENLITKEKIHHAIITSLREIKQNWLNNNCSEIFKDPEEELMKKSCQAFLYVQNYSADLWIQDHLPSQVLIDHSNDMKTEKQHQRLEQKLNQYNDTKFIVKFKSLKRGDFGLFSVSRTSIS